MMNVWLQLLWPSLLYTYIGGLETQYVPQYNILWEKLQQTERGSVHSSNLATVRNRCINFEQQFTRVFLIHVYSTIIVAVKLSCRNQCHEGRHILNRRFTVAKHSYRLCVELSLSTKDFYVF